jgi:hypothetical protein
MSLVWEHHDVSSGLQLKTCRYTPISQRVQSRFGAGTILLLQCVDENHPSLKPCEQDFRQSPLCSLIPLFLTETTRP